MPAQAIGGAGAFRDEVLAVICEQLDLHRGLVEIGRGEALDALADDRARDRERVDLIGLSGLARSSARLAHQPWGDPDDAFTGSVR